MSWFTKNPFKAKVLFGLTLVLFFFILLLLTELILGYFSYKNKYRSLLNSNHRFVRLKENPPNLNMQYIMSEDAKKKNNIVNLSEDKFILRTDMDGFVEPSKIHNNADMNIFFIGGSTTECRALDEKKRFPYLVGRILEEKTGLKINSFNAGVSGNHSFHSIDILLNKILPYKPQIVVFKHNSNDILLIPYGSYWNNSSKKSLITYSNNTGNKKEPDNNLLFPVLGEWAGNAISLFSKTSELAEDHIPYNYPKYSEVGGKRIVVNKNEVTTLYRNSLRTFVEICKTWNIEPVFMTQVILNQNNIKPMNDIPDVFEFTMPEKPMQDSAILTVLYSYHHVFNGIIREVATEEEITLIDLKNLVQADDHRYLYDLYHYNDAGSELVAQIISKHLLDLTCIKQKRN
ncbi:MAG: SGNH/GDSL hydrolase family protein [Bacteroidota bacterium]